MQRDIAGLAFHSLGAADFASCFLLPRVPLVHEYCGDGPWFSYGSGCHGARVGEQDGAGGARDERKARRLASNRESARRRRQLDELASRVAELRDANAWLAVELNRLAAAHAGMARENAQLREEQRGLRERLAAAEATTAKEPQKGNDH